MKLITTTTYFITLTLPLLHAFNTPTLNNNNNPHTLTHHLYTQHHPNIAAAPPVAKLTKRTPNQSPAHLDAHAETEGTTELDRSHQKRFFNTQTRNTYIQEIQRVQNETEKCYTRMGWSLSTIPQYSLTVMPSIPWWMLLAGDDRRKKRFYSYRTRYDLTQLKAIYSECKGRWMNCTKEVEKSLNLILPPIQQQADLLQRCADLNGHPVIQPDYWRQVLNFPLQKLFYLLKIYLADVKACFARIGRLPNGDLITTTTTTTTTTTPKPTTTTTTTTTTTPKPTTTTTTTTTTTPKPTTTTTTTTTTTPLPTTTPGVFTTTTTPIPTTTLC